MPHPGSKSIDNQDIEPAAAAGSGRPVRLGIVFPSDPLGTVPGGIETFIRGIIRWAPAEIEVSVLGITTDPAARPVGRWTDCRIGPKNFRHYAAYAVGDPKRQPRIPATVKYIARLAPRMRAMRGLFDVLEFHRIEPVVLFVGNKTPKTAIFHQNMDVIHSKDSDIRWKHMPGLYFRVESFLMHKLSTVFVVREDAVQAYRTRYTDLADRFRFTPTWMDPEVFAPVSAEQRVELRRRLLAPHGVGERDRVLITVGRLDSQKDPLLLLDSFASLVATHADLKLVFVGDGVLREDAEKRARELGVAERVIFAGLMGPAAVAEHLNAADLFVLSSAYEGMPISLLEAMGCGLPACSTDVGEVKRAVESGVNGEVVAIREPPEFARALATCLAKLETYRGEPALASARRFVPRNVLTPLYENYRRLAAGAAAQ